MKVAFTGTRNGMSAAQKSMAKRLLKRLAPISITHGDCVGADDNIDRIAENLGIERLIRPCDIPRARAHCEKREGTRVIAPPKPPLVRNGDIVADGDILLACPKGFYEETYSGTWATVRRARKYDKSILIIWPDGKVTTEVAPRKPSYS